MKLAKKLLACVIALALVGCFAVTAFAAESDVKVTITADKNDAAVGDTVNVTVNLSNTTGITGGSVDLGFNKDVLEYKSVSTAGANPVGFVDTGMKSGTDNIFVLGLMISNAATVDEFDLAVVTFEVIGEGEYGITAAADQFENEDGELEAVIDNKASDYATGDETTTEEDDTTTEDDDTTTTKKDDDDIPQTGDSASLSIAAGLVVLAGAAFVVSKKRK